MNAFRTFSILAGALVVAACGGSSSGGFDQGGSPEMSISAETTEVPAKGQHFEPNPEKDYTVQVNVRFLEADGSAVDNGTEVTLSSSSSSRGVVAPADDPQAIGSQATSPTSGGTARFWFVAGATQGSVTLTASGSAPTGGTATAELELTVIEPSDGASRLSIEGKQTIPANKQDVDIFKGSPFINELKIRYLGPDGEPGMVRPDSDDRHTAQVTISPTTRAVFSTLVDPETEVDDFTFLLGTGPVLVQAGVGTIFVHSRDEPGQVTVTATAQDIDEEDENVYSAEFTMEVIDDASDLLPAQIDFDVSPDPVYIKDSGGATAKQISLDVRDSGGNAVPDPEGHGATFNNVLLELIAPEGSGARLTGTNADGDAVSGQEIRVRTVNGLANFALNAGTETGSHEIIATVDRADNNVDNDLIDPLTAETSVEVGDGRLFNLELVSPANTVLINRASNLVETELEPVVDEETGVLIPPDPDGTYSLPVTVQATDRVGNPVLPGMQINFGKIDSPLTLTSPRQFVFSGGDGDPEEGGSLFSVIHSEDGFLDNSNVVDEAVEPGDVLTMFGKSVPGNREHEAVRTVESVIDNNTVAVADSFNPNDGSGSMVDDGHVIPWAIGRSRVGVIDASANLGEDGRATVIMTYTSSDIGRPLIVWGQGSRPGETVTKTVADVEATVFPGIAPLLLTASPSTVAGNSTAEIRLCLTDAIGAPVNGVSIRGTITGGGAAGRLDGEPMPTETADVTGSDGSGCVITELQTSNMLPDGDAALALFNFGAAEAQVIVVAPEAGRLEVDPSRARDVSEGPQAVGLTLTLLDPAGEPVPGVNLSGQCDEGITLDSGPGVTDEDGETNATVLLELSECPEEGGEGGDDFPREAQCEFTTPSGAPIGIFTGEGVDLSELNVSPPACE